MLLMKKLPVSLLPLVPKQSCFNKRPDRMTPIGEMAAPPQLMGKRWFWGEELCRLLCQLPISTLDPGFSWEQVLEEPIRESRSHLHREN